jgi:hypothetical protein
MLDSDPEDEPVAPPRRQPSQPSASPSPSPRPFLLPLSPQEKPEPKEPPRNWDGLLTRMKPDAPKKALKGAQKKQRKEPTPPPKKDTEGRAWLPRDEWLAQQRRRATAAEGGFDPLVHGYWLTRSRGLVYRFPDGRELPATGVDAFDT